jgi:protoheme IX farnesyltransferase
MNVRIAQGASQMNESLPTLAPSNRTVQVLTLAILGMVLILPIAPIVASIIAGVALLAMILAWVYTAPLRWPSVIVMVSCIPLLIWPTLLISSISIAISTSYLFIVSVMPDSAAQRLGGKREQARSRYLVLLYATIIALVLVTVMGDIGAITCTALPLCGDNGMLAQLQNSHRIFSVVAGIFVLIAIVQTLRTFATGAVRPISIVVGVTLIVQIVIGLIVTQGVVQSIIHVSISMLSIVSATMLASVAQRNSWPITAVPEVPSKPAEADDFVGPYTWREKIKDYVSLTKPGVISLLILTTITSMYITPAGLPSLALVLWTAVGGWLMAAASHAFNCYLDRDIDVLMGRTGRRPIPSGRIPGWHAIVLGVVLMLLAAVILVVYANWLAAALAFAGLVYYVFIYTMWLKRSTFNNIVIGGGAGAFPPLVGWAAMTGSLTLPSLFLFAIIFYWTPPHFWALAIIRSKDYARAGVPMLPVVAGDAETRWQIVLYTILMFIVTIMPTPLQMLGMAYLVMAVGLGAIFAYYALRLNREGTTASAWGLYRYSLLYLALLFGAMVIDRLYFA